MSERVYAAEPLIDIGSPIPGEWAERLTEAFVDTSTGLPAEAYLRFHDPGHRLLGSLKASIGTPVRVSVVTSRDRTRTGVFTGEVIALETEFTTAGGTYTIVRAMDLGHRLLRGRRVTSYADTTVADVVSKIARRARMTCGPIQADSARIPFLAQLNLSDWEMVQHLAAERGLTVSVEGTKLCLRKPTAAGTAPSPRSGAMASPFVLQQGMNLISLRAGLSSTGQVANVEVRGWDPVSKQPLAHREPATTSDRLQVGTTSGSASKAFGSDSTLLVTGRPYTTAHDVQNAARALAADTSAAFADVEAVAVGAPQLRAGAAVALAGVGSPFEGKYTIASSRHLFNDRDGYRTRIRVTTHSLAPVPPAPPLSTRGVAVGVVADTKEPHEGQHGWVRLRLPWLGPDYVTDWVRTVQSGGVGGGGVFPVELEDEVLVGFEHGRLDRPYVLGGLYNGKDKPGDHAGIKLIDPSSGKVNRRSFASRDTDRIEILTPAEGSQGIRLSTGKDSDLYTVLMDRNKKAITLTAGTDAESLGVCLDRAHKAVTVTAGTDTNKVTFCLDHGKKELTLDAGPEGTLTLKAAHVKIQPSANTKEKTSTFAVNSHTIALEADQEGTLTANGKTMKLGSAGTDTLDITTGTGTNKVSITTKTAAIETTDAVNWTSKDVKFTVSGTFEAANGSSKVTVNGSSATVANGSSNVSVESSKVTVKGTAVNID
ncbi:VgrG-related protein [Streptomyces formicae]|uniref:VgrG-related protein n=1 Tax=Streptomyces formicae TaxID=1616117 RepID=A0ABY3WK94_9ACTN|nr:VgrG-related protein [Streptomyces formicae]UNM13024.1 VgrG-related protein [Streptomyces formicae]